jgi:hypothetical protein
VDQVDHHAALAELRRKFDAQGVAFAEACRNGRATASAPLDALWISGVPNNSRQISSRRYPSHAPWPW